MRTNLPGLTAAIVLALEGVGLLVAAGWMATGLLSGEAGDIASAGALLVITLAGAAALLSFAYAVLRGRSWGRSGGIVAQLLVVAVGIGAMTGTYAHPMTGIALTVPAALTFLLLLFAARDAARHAPDSPESTARETSEN